MLLCAAVAAGQELVVQSFLFLPRQQGMHKRTVSCVLKMFSYQFVGLNNQYIG